MLDFACDAYAVRVYFSQKAYWRTIWVILKTHLHKYSWRLLICKAHLCKNKSQAKQFARLLKMFEFNFLICTNNYSACFKAPIYAWVSVLATLNVNKNKQRSSITDEHMKTFWKYQDPTSIQMMMSLLPKNDATFPIKFSYFNCVFGERCSSFLLAISCTSPVVAMLVCIPYEKCLFVVALCAGHN